MKRERQRRGKTPQWGLEKPERQERPETRETRDQRDRRSSSPQQTDAPRENLTGEIHVDRRFLLNPHRPSWCARARTHAHPVRVIELISLFWSFTMSTLAMLLVCLYPATLSFPSSLPSHEAFFFAFIFVPSNLLSLFHSFTSLPSILSPPHFLSHVSFLLSFHFLPVSLHLPNIFLHVSSFRFSPSSGLALFSMLLFSLTWLTSRHQTPPHPTYHNPQPPFLDPTAPPPHPRSTLVSTLVI